MQMRVLAVGRGGDRIVRLATTEGEVAAEWVGDLPEPGDVVDVDLEIEDRLVLDRTVFKAGAGSPVPDAPTAIRGTVEVVAEDDVLVVRIGDGLVQVEVDPQAASALPPGTRIALLPGTLLAYPTGT